MRRGARVDTFKLACDCSTMPDLTSLRKPIAKREGELEEGKGVKSVDEHGQHRSARAYKHVDEA